MIIESISIKSFGRLRDFTCEPGEGLTVFAGENESGKSTVCAFIRYMLYGFARAGGRELGEKKRRIGWQSGYAGGSMVVRTAEGRYRIERSTVAVTGARGQEDFREESKIIDLESNMPLPKGKCAGELLLGVPEEVYLQTAFVGSIGDARPGDDSLCGAIENLLFAGDEQISLPRALEKLEQQRRALLHKNGKGGELYELREKESALSARLEQAQAQHTALQSTERELEKLQEEYTALEEQTSRAAAVERQQRSILLVQAYDRLHAAEGSLAEAEAALIEMDGLPAHRLTERDLADLTVARRLSEEQHARLTTLRQEHRDRAARHIDEDSAAALLRAEGEGGLDLLATHTGQLFRRATLLLAGAGGCLALSLLLLVLGLLPATGGALPLVGAGLLAIPALVCLLLGLSARRDAMTICRAYGANSHAALLTRLSQLRSAREAEITLRTAEEDALLRMQRCEVDYRRTEGELDTVVRRFDTRLPEGDATAFLDELCARVRQMLENKKSREQARTEAAAQVRALRERLRGTSEAAARANLPEGELPREEDLQPEEWKKQVEYGNARLRILAERKRELENTLLSVRSRAEDPAALEAALDSLRRRLAAVQEKHAACVMAYEALSGAAVQLRAQISPRLSGYACRLMDEVTDGRYADIGVGSDLSLSVGTDAGTRVPDYLSRGTQDLVYLSLRLALIDLLYREKPPVCFDESFVHQDDRRLSRVMQALAAEAEGGTQCLLFTCHARESEAARAACADAVCVSIT